MAGYSRTYRQQWRRWLRGLATSESDILLYYEQAFVDLEPYVMEAAGSSPSSAVFRRTRAAIKERMAFLQRQVADEVAGVIKHSIEDTIEGQMAALGAEFTARGWVIDLLPKPDRLFALQEDAFRYLMNNPADGIPLSKRIWQTNQKTTQELMRRLSFGVLKGESSAKIAQDIKQYLTDPMGSARQAGTAKALRTKARTAWKAGDKERARRLFASARGVEEQLPKMGAGYYRSPIKNALRVVRSEATRAHFVSTVNYAKSHKDVISGVKWVISAGHPMIDICDDLVGDYRTDSVPFPPHPLCICHLEYILSADLTGKEIEFGEPPEYMDVIGKKRIVDPALLERRAAAMKQAQKAA